MSEASRSAVMWPRGNCRSTLESEAVPLRLLLWAWPIREARTVGGATTAKSILPNILPKNEDDMAVVLIFGEYGESAKVASR